ncbi:multimeric flavodoxin WrbA [Desulfofundulus luciae]|uniref:Multimeric flavodoxin WrbA n=1 Tax=Desulfofundulus luciae TaxID=74702 RepID=A0ABU0B4G9_9FIRM|nr:flavodoxin family protein [Desulfofundulus luciae]MDQ0287607.1 multimeric flavodoxin WrbA [Desulfofundulus luciae]
MKILAINGSHRKGKNTAIMLQAVLDEAAKSGAETELVELVDYNIKPCLACNRCLGKTECSIKDDDMGVLAGKMLAADGIVLGSPVYWANVTGLMKNFIDRTRWMHMVKNLLHGKVGGAVTHAGLRNGGQEHALAIMERFLVAQGFILVDTRDQESGICNGGAMGTMFNNLEEGRISWKRGVHEDLLALEECRRLGRNMVEMIKRLGRA